MNNITYSEYWQAVLGPRNAARVVDEFFLTTKVNRREVDEWLGTAEEEAISAGHLPREETLEAWESHHGKAVDELLAACDGDVDHNHTKHDGSWWEKDAQGIPLCRVCPKCRSAKLARYRPEILTGYTQEDVNEPIEEEDR